MGDEINHNQHYITESFVKKRFGINGLVQRYDIKHDSWKTNASPQFIFSGAGYTQFLEEGLPVDNSLETAFSKLENQLRIILPALDDAAARAETKFPEDVYYNLCLYCAFLWYLSPFAKAKAPANFLMELEWHLKQGKWDYVRDWAVSENTVQAMKAQHEQGFHFIFKGENYLQYLFRVQFALRYEERAKMFRYQTKWTVWNSPVELPISDIALIDMPVGDATLHILPISPQRVLIGRVKHGKQVISTDTVVYGKTLLRDAAEEVLDMICLSAVKAVACKNRMDLKGIRERAKQQGMAFHRIKNLEEVLSAGSKVFDRKKGLHLVPVSLDDYKTFVHSFIAPTED